MNLLYDETTNESSAIVSAAVRLPMYAEREPEIVRGWVLPDVKTMFESVTEPKAI